jgi:hypothetical protein
MGTFVQHRSGYSDTVARKDHRNRPAGHTVSPPAATLSGRMTGH